MNNLIKKSGLFLILLIALSALTGCDKSVETSVHSANTTNTSSAETKKSEYPLLPATLAQAENESLDGKIIKLEDYKGKVVILNFWATWCRPCLEEMPHLVELQETYKDKGLEVIGLTIEPDDTPEKVKAFAEKQGLNYTLGWIDGKTRDEFLKISKFDGIPQTFLINKQGQIAGVFTGGNISTIAKLKDFARKSVIE